MDFDRRGKCKAIGLGAAPGENHIAWPRTNQRRNLLARLLDQPPGCAPLAMDGGRIANDIERRDQDVIRLRPQRRSCIPVEIDALRHFSPT